MKAGIIILVVVLILFIVGWAIGAHRGPGDFGDASEFLAKHPLAKTLAEHFPLPALDLCALTRCDVSNTITVGLAGRGLEIPKDKTSRKVDIPKLPAGMSLEYNDYGLDWEGKPLPVRKLPADDGSTGPTSIFPTRDGGILTFRCAQFSCTLNLK